MRKHDKQYLPGWSEVASKRGEIRRSRLYTEEDLRKFAAKRKRGEPVKTGIPGWDQRAAERMDRMPQPKVEHFPGGAVITSHRPKSGAAPWDDDSTPAPKAKAVVAAYQQPKGKAKPRRKPGRILYIAYGSNLHKRSMWQRCPSAIYRGKITLTNARLVFRGVADLQIEKGAKCPAGVWEINEEDEGRLDSYEGVKSGMYSKHMIPIGKTWGHKEALIYLMNDDGVYPPSHYYAGIIRRGYRDFGLDEGYLDAAIKDSFTGKNPSEQTRRRRRKQKSGDVQRRLVEVPPEVAEEHAARMRELAEQAQAEARQQLNGELAKQVFGDVMLPRSYEEEI